MSKHVGIVGGGIVGVATAYQLSLLHPDLSITLWEKEAEVASHQTGRNSGVIHSGIYYVPGSLKASTCLHGRRLMEEFCSAHNLPWERCGKVIVATRPDELERLEKLYQRGLSHGLQVQRLTPEQLRDFEPYCAGLAALLVPETGIINYKSVTQQMAQICRDRGVRIHLGCPVKAVTRSPHWSIHTPTGEFPVDLWINCAGLHSDHMVRWSGQAPGAAIIPFRGEYYQLTPEARPLCRNLIYPVPDPRFPFLGVHFTRGVDGSVEAGPNAVLSLGRENYTKWDINWSETWETLSYPGFRKLAWRFWRMGAEEMARSFSKVLFHRALQRLIPRLRIDQLEAGGAGIRAQAVTVSGDLVDDFLIQQQEGVVHVVNAPSPAATSSLAIAEHVVSLVGPQLSGS